MKELYINSIYLRWYAMWEKKPADEVDLFSFRGEPVQRRVKGVNWTICIMPARACHSTGARMPTYSALDHLFRWTFTSPIFFLLNPIPDFHNFICSIFFSLLLFCCSGRVGWSCPPK
jgi:hypothetical protein